MQLPVKQRDVKIHFIGVDRVIAQEWNLTVPVARVAS
jgi:hypothetical protein